MRDWSGAVHAAERHIEKAVSEMTLIHRGITPQMREALCDTSDARLRAAMEELLYARLWLLLQRQQ